MVFLIMAYSKIHLFTTGADSGPENAFCTGRPKPCLLYPLPSVLSALIFGLGQPVIRVAVCDARDLECIVGRLSSAYEAHQSL